MSKRYAIKEIFDTLQGEGMRAGRRSVFVRFAGCNLWDGHENGRLNGKGACARWCDTDFAKGDPLGGDEILAEMDRQWPKGGLSDEPRSCVLTGGEPMLQVDRALLCRLWDNDWSVAIETNGTKYEPFLSSIHVCVSPKLGAEVVLETADEVKVVIPGHIDPTMGWTNEQLDLLATRFHPHAYLSVQPMDPVVFDSSLTFKTQLSRCLEIIRRDHRWALSLQTHKLIGLP